MTLAAIVLALVACALVYLLHQQTICQSVERASMQVRHLEYCKALQEEIRNLTASMVRSTGGIFVTPQSESKPTASWFSGKPSVALTPKTKG